MVEHRNVMLQAKPDVCVLVRGAFPRHLDVGRLERNRLVAVGFGYFHAAIPHPMIHVATPEENQPRLEFRFVRDECHTRLYRLTRPVQIPCRFFSQVLESAYLCRIRIDTIKSISRLFLFIYNIVVILSEAEESRSSQIHCVRSNLSPKTARRCRCLPPCPQIPSS